MGFNFRKSVNVGKGFKVNLSKSGVGYSWGKKGFRTTKTASGEIRNTFSIPGTGISYTQRSGKSRKGKIWVVIVAVLVIGGILIFNKLQINPIESLLDNLMPSSSEVSPNDVVVYLSSSGEKYHKEDCSTLKATKTKVTLDEAIKDGYSPCKICKPPTK